MLPIRRRCLLASLLAIHSVVLADAPEAPREPKQMADRVMAKVAAGETEEGILLCKAFSVDPNSKWDSYLEEIKAERPSTLQRFGATVDTQFVREVKVSEHLVRLIYMERCEKYPMAWAFTFYRGKDEWRLSSLSRDGGLDVLFY